MPQPIDTNHTTKNLSLEELVEHRKRLDQHRQNRKAGEGLLQRAWYTAHKTAAMLYKDFGATYEILSTELKTFIKWLEKQTDKEN